MKPDTAENLNRLGITHAQRRQFKEAAACFRQAALADPTSASSHANLANVLAELGDFQSARASYQQALNLQPQAVDVHCNFGVMLTRIEDHSGAADSFQRATQLDPNHAPANAGLGMALSRLGRHREAIPALRRAIALLPQDAALHSSLGKSLLKTGDHQAGLKSLEQALRLQPNFPDAHFILADGLMAVGRISEALPHFDAALKLEPAHAERHCQYAAALMEAGRLSDSLAHLDAAIQLKPDFEAAIRGRSMVLLLAGDYTRGWREYDRRMKDLSIIRFKHPEPIWDGSPLAGRTLLLEAEQGKGDTIQFVRYAQEIKRHHTGRILVAVEPPLIPLLTGLAGADAVISQQEPRPPFDVWTPLMSLPGIMQHDPTCFPAPIPYLKADPARIEKWQARLAARRASVPLASAGEDFKVGIAWQGSTATVGDHRRSFPLAAFAPLAKVPGVALISLQKGHGSEQLANLTDFKVHTLGDDFDASGGAFLDAAAVMHSLDLIISADTSIGHLAGALGFPIWLALAFVPDWRWTMHGDRTPWYPTMRLFRQPRPGDWPSVFEQMAQALARASLQRKQE